MKTAHSMFSMTGKTVLITGATGHLGAAMAFALAEAGAHVLVNSRSLDRAQSLVEALIRNGFTAEIAVFDVTDRAAMLDYVGSLGDLPLDCLINNAYIGGAGTVELSSPDAYISSYDIAVVSAHNLVQGALRNLRIAAKSGQGASVINFASMYALVSPDQNVYESGISTNPPFYGAAKAALIQWTRYAACEFGKENIRFNSISPGPFPSDLVKAENGKFIDRLRVKVPLGRVGVADEIKGPILFLASAASSFVNGANIVVDGGWTSW